MSLTRVETYIDEQIRPHLGEGEVISHRAYLRVSRGPKRDASLMRARAKVATAFLTGGGTSLDRDNRGYFIALTAARLFLIETRPGTFGPALKNFWMGSWSPSDIRITTAPDGLHLDTRDGHSFVLEIDASTKHCSSQAELLQMLGVRG